MPFAPNPCMKYCRKAQLIVKEGALEGLTAISMESWSKEAGDQVVKDSGAELKVSGPG